MSVRSFGAGIHLVNDPSIKWAGGKGPGSDGTPALLLSPANSTTGTCLQVENLSTSVGDCEGISAAFNWVSNQTGATETTLVKICPTNLSPNARCYFEFYGSPGSGYLGVKYKISTDQTGPVITTAQKATNYFDGDMHTIAATVEVTGGLLIVSLYVDGILQASANTAVAITALPAMDAICVGGAYNFSPARLTSGTYCNLAIYNSVLSADDMLSLFNAADNAFAGELVTDRLNRLMDWADISGTDFDDSVTTCSRHMPDEMALLDAMRLPVATDGGTLYINGSDQIAFRSANTKQLAAVPALTLNAGDLSEAPKATQNDALLVNDITINRLGNSTSQRFTSPASIAQFGTHDKSIDTLLETGREARAMGGYFIAFFSQPITRFDTISVEALLLADWTALLSVSMWEIIRITGLPASAPATQLDSHLEGIQWDITADSWLVTFDVSYAIPFAIIGDVTRGLMGTNVVGI